jgi:hypothetical protein
VKIASEICIFTNDHITTEEIDLEEEQPVGTDSKSIKGTDLKSIKGTDLKSVPKEKG